MFLPNFTITCKRVKCDCRLCQFWKRTHTDSIVTIFSQLEIKGLRGRTDESDIFRQQRYIQQLGVWVGGGCLMKYPNFSKKDQNCLLEKIGRKKTRMCPDALVQNKMLGKQQSGDKDL